MVPHNATFNLSALKFWWFKNTGHQPMRDKFSELKRNDFKQFLDCTKLKYSLPILEPNFIELMEFSTYLSVEITFNIIHKHIWIRFLDHQWLIFVGFHKQGLFQQIFPLLLIH